jgi:BolA protein
MTRSRVAAIRDRLTQTLAPTELEVIDDSHKHVGHTGHQGAGHFTVKITADCFRGKRLIERHRLVYEALGDLMQTEIHALAIEASE